jgi:hypothetical protein
MTDEMRDPELQGLRAHWAPPSAPGALDERVLAGYRREFRSRSLARRVWLPVLAAVLLFAAIRIAAVRPEHREPGFVPVRQPQLIIVSQGERP